MEAFPISSKTVKEQEISETLINFYLHFLTYLLPAMLNFIQILFWPAILTLITS